MENWLEISKELTAYTSHVFQNCFLKDLKLLTEAERKEGARTIRIRNFSDLLFISHSDFLVKSVGHNDCSK